MIQVALSPFNYEFLAVTLLGQMNLLGCLLVTLPLRKFVFESFILWRILNLYKWKPEGQSGVTVIYTNLDMLLWLASLQICNFCLAKLLNCSL